MIEFDDVSVTYRGGVKALRNVSLTIDDGELVVVVGLSGAGKSTLLRAINGLVPATSGSITVDGVSLTITAVTVDSFELVLIPHTLSVTVLGSRRVGDQVNVEVDILAKYVERLLEDRQ